MKVIVLQLSKISYLLFTSFASLTAGFCPMSRISFRTLKSILFWKKNLTFHRPAIGSDPYVFYGPSKGQRPNSRGFRGPLFHGYLLPKLSGFFPVLSSTFDVADPLSARLNSASLFFGPHCAAQRLEEPWALLSM